MAFTVDAWFLVALASGPVFVALLPHISFLPLAPWHPLSRELVVSAMVLYPLTEEVLFRGVLQPFILQSKWGQLKTLGFSRANFVASIIFCVAHLFSHQLLWSAAVFFPSMIFGFFRDRFRSFWPALVLHMTYNACYFGAALTR